MEDLTHVVWIKDEGNEDELLSNENIQPNDGHSAYPQGEDRDSVGDTTEKVGIFVDGKHNEASDAHLKNDDNVENIVIKPEIEKYEAAQCPIPEEEPIPSGPSSVVFANGFIALTCTNCKCSLPHNQPNMWSSGNDASINLYCYQCYYILNGSKVLSYTDPLRIPRRVRVFECCDCVRSFNRKYDLTRHIETVHQKVRNFVCSECGYSFTKNSSMLRHVDAVHKKTKNFKCAECTKAFARQVKLVEHIETVHRKFKKFQCPDCSQGFTQKAHLFRHVETIHNIIEDIQI